MAEINRLNERHWQYQDQTVVISSNLRQRRDGLPESTYIEPKDTGVAVYFNLRFVRNGKYWERPVVLTCDKWTRAAWNLYAIAKEAQRARHRWGCTNIEQAFRGYTAIPERCGGLSWWATLGVDADAPEQVIKDAFRVKALTEHPDKGGTHERWTKLQEAFDQAMARFRE